MSDEGPYRGHVHADVPIKPIQPIPRPPRTTKDILRDLRVLEVDMEAARAKIVAAQERLRGFNLAVAWAAALTLLILFILSLVGDLRE